MKKDWYIGLTAEEIVDIMIEKADDIVKTALVNKDKEEKLFIEFTNDFKEVISIIDVKSKFYMYRLMYNTWDWCHRELLKIKNEMEDELLKLDI